MGVDEPYLDHQVNGSMGSHFRIQDFRARQLLICLRAWGMVTDKASGSRKPRQVKHTQRNAISSHNALAPLFAVALCGGNLNDSVWYCFQ